MPRERDSPAVPRAHRVYSTLFSLYSALLCSALPCPALPYPAYSDLPCPVLSCPALLRRTP